VRYAPSLLAALVIGITPPSMRPTESLTGRVVATHTVRLSQTRPCTWTASPAKRGPIPRARSYSPASPPRRHGPRPPRRVLRGSRHCARG
jgi:hypothetical protein